MRNFLGRIGRGVSNAASRVRGFFTRRRAGGGGGRGG